ncbi:MAG TPA: DUF2948 family protein [Azospirillaceae bacterium]|nr:DUF2948 family protein [Azospirillaceae bacterium]
MNRPLKLRAEDADDLKVVSAFLQDAIMPIGEMCYLPDERRFVMVVNRFKWEGCRDETALAGGPMVDEEDIDCPFERTNCGVRVEGVTGVRSRGIDMKDRRQILELLTVESDDDGVTMHFAGGGCIHLDAGSWLWVMEDLGEPWPTSRKPNHPDEG